MKHLQNSKEKELIDTFEEIAKQSVEYFNSDPNIETDVKFFEEMNISKRNVYDYLNTFNNILRKYHLKLENYDNDSIIIVKLELWKESEILTTNNTKTGVFEKIMKYINYEKTN